VEDRRQRTRPVLRTGYPQVAPDATATVGSSQREGWHEQTVCLLLSLYPGAWEYVFASEQDPDVADTLFTAHAPRGLARDLVYSDARSPAATQHAPGVDVWFATPPCQSYSRRNHTRSDASDVAAVSDLDLMLAYVRSHRPNAVVIENVDEPALRTTIAAAGLISWRPMVAMAVPPQITRTQPTLTVCSKRTRPHPADPSSPIGW